MRRLCRALLGLVVLVACAAPRRRPPPSIVPLDLSAAPAHATLAVLDDGALPLPEAGEAMLPWFAFCADVAPADVLDALAATRAGAAGSPPGGFTFAACAAEPAIARRRVRRLEEVLVARQHAILARVQRILPAGTPAGPELPVRVVLGLPEGAATAVAPDGSGRVVLLDAWQLFAEAGGSADRVGERVERWVARQLFHLRYEGAAPAGTAPAGAAARALAVARDEAVGTWLALPQADHFDDLGRRTPLQDAVAREALARFAENLRRLQDPALAAEERRSLVWSAYNGPLEERWATYAFVMMIDAIDRFGPVGELKEVLAGGPEALVAAYAAAAGAHAAVPPLDLDVLGLLR